MTTVSELRTKVLAAAQRYPRCTTDQALVYACEDVVIAELGERTVRSEDVSRFVDSVCEAEDVDTAEVVFGRAGTRTVASVEMDARRICIRGAATGSSTVIHEVAHLTSGSGDHGRRFRSELVRLSRAHLSVEHAALLHRLFVEVDLPVDAWPTDAGHRRHS